MKIRFRYKRILPYERVGISLSRRGKPSSNNLIPYSRKFGFGRESTLKPSARGGHTLCEIVSDNGEVIASGEAWCSMSDAFNYKIGRRIAEGRARKALSQA